MKLKARLFEYKTAMLYYLFRIFPIKRNKVVFCNYNGKGYGCNPKYIAEEMHKRNKWDMVWLVSDMESKFPEYVRKVQYNSWKSIYELATAGVWIDNQRKLWYHRKRKKQFFIETWHGAGIPMKKIGADNPRNLNNKPYEHTSKHMNKIADMMICNSRACTEIFHRTFLYTGPILECGYPRNDILVNGSVKIRAKVYEKFGLDNQCKTVLYAPTYRTGRQTDMYRLEVEELLKILQERFGGEWKLLLRLHPTMKQKAKELTEKNKQIINASDYDDMQELLFASDVLISDYSSVISEFAITGKPVFLYAEDIKEYAIDRDFYTDYYSLPFPIADSNEILFNNIRIFDENGYQKAVKMFLDKVGMKEPGTAAKQIVDILEKVKLGEEVCLRNMES